MLAIRSHCWLAVVAASLPAQETGQAPVDVAQLARQVRRSDLDAEALADVAGQLLAAGDRGAVALLETLALEAAEATKAFRGEAARLRAGFERRARSALAARKGKDGDRRIGTLRFEILQISRSPELGKDEIRDGIDPRLAELRRLATVDVEAVFEHAPALALQRDKACAAAARLRQLHELRVLADARLQESAAGRSLLERHEGFPDPRPLIPELDAALAQLAEHTTPISQRDARVLAANEALAEGADEEERACARELNRVRVLLGLPVLALDVRLCAAARGHSADMAQHGFFSHRSPVPGKETFGDRAAQAGTTASAENIAAGQSTGAAAFRAWWYSPGHHQNMLKAALRVGVGRHEQLWTQVFGG